MLSHVPVEAETVLANIERLALCRTFDTVLLASYLINHPAPAARQNFANAMRRHVCDQGQALVERHDVQLMTSLYAGRSSSMQGLQMLVEAVHLDRSDVEMTVKYEMDDATWRHSFRCRLLSEAEVEDLLAEAGFSSFEWLGPRRKWLCAKVK
jgi:hypothetical protein